MSASPSTDDDDHPGARPPPPAAAPANSNADVDAGARAKPPSLFTRAFVRLLLMQAAFGFAFSVFLLLPKILAATYGARPEAIGLVMGAFGVASLLSIPLVARLLERFGSRATLVIANAVLSAGALGFVLVHGADAAAVVLRGVQGLAWSLGFAACMVVAADLAPAAQLAQAVGLVGAGSLAMNALAPALAEPLGERFGPRAVFVLAAAAAATGAWLARGLPARTSPRYGLGAPVLAGKTQGGGASVSASASVWRQRAPIYLSLAVAGLAFGVMFTFIAPFALDHGVRAVRGFFAAYTAAALGVRVLAGRVSDRLGHARVASVSAVGYGLAVLAGGLFGPTHLVLLGVGFGAAHGALFPSVMALLLAQATGSARAGALAVANGAMNVGIAGVFGLGLVAGRVGYPPVFVLAGALTVASAALLAWPGGLAVTFRSWRRRGAPAPTPGGSPAAPAP